MISKNLRRSTITTGTVVALLSVSGCGGSGGYSVPERVCGLRVPAENLERLLPSGEKITVAEELPVSHQKRCTVTVDRNEVLHIDEWRHQSHFDALEHARKTRRERNPERVSGAENAVIADGEFIAVIRCGAGDDEISYIVDMVLMEPRAETRKEKRDELERFAVSYVKASRDKAGCAE